jgi:hypothetical protein
VLENECDEYTGGHPVTHFEQVGTIGLPVLETTSKKIHDSK